MRAGSEIAKGDRRSASRSWVSCAMPCVRRAWASSRSMPEKGIVKYAKPAGVIVSLIPSTNPELTPPGNGIYALKCKDAVIFSPHPASKQTTFEMVKVMRKTLRKLGAPEDLFQCVEAPSIPLSQELMSICDLTIATGGMPMVRAAYSSGKPAFGVGSGNSTMVIDETADIADAARNTRISKTSDNGSGCSADGNLVVDSIHLRRISSRNCRTEGGYLAHPTRSIAREGDVGSRGSTHACNRGTVRRARSRGSRDSRFRQIANSSSSREAEIGKAASLLRRKAFAGACDLQVHRLRHGARTWFARFIRSVAQVILVASIRSMMTISIGLH